jgi:hypothetical protein
MQTDLTLDQGKTFQRVVRWFAPPFVYKPINNITQGAPATITVPGHGMPDQWLCAVVGVQGMDEINAPHYPPRVSDMVKGTAVDANTVALNTVISADFSPYKSGGFLVYYTPVDLTGFTARMTIKNKVGGTALYALISPTNFTFDNVAKTITMSIDAVTTASFTPGQYVYDLEAVSATGVVSLLLSGNIIVVPEVTT